jgi:hypothetical protein
LKINSHKYYVLTGVILPVVACVFVFTTRPVAQMAAPAPAPAQSAVMPKDAGGQVKFNVPRVIMKAGFAFNLCTGQQVPLPGPYSDMVGQTLDTNQGQCGDLNGPRPGGTVAGGNPPYHFTLDTMGGFPPIGMHLGLNGLLYGTPSARPPLGGWPPFHVCAVDLNGSPDCHEVPFEAPPANAAKAKGHLGAELLLGGLAAVAIGAVAAKSSSSSASCGSAPANPLDVCSIPNNTVACNADLSAYSTWCECEGYAGGFSASQGECVN